MKKIEAMTMFVQQPDSRYAPRPLHIFEEERARPLCGHEVSRECRKLHADSAAQILIHHEGVCLGCLRTIRRRQRWSDR